jgi:hypothetical protein
MHVSIQPGNRQFQGTQLKSNELKSIQKNVLRNCGKDLDQPRLDHSDLNESSVPLNADVVTVPLWSRHKIADHPTTSER